VSTLLRRHRDAKEVVWRRQRDAIRGGVRRGLQIGRHREPIRAVKIRHALNRVQGPWQRGPDEAEAVVTGGCAGNGNVTGRAVLDVELIKRYD